jgi:hypothetical protein
LFVSGTGLYELHADYSSTLLATVTENARMSHAEINGRVYYLNGYEKGYIEDSIAHTWEKGSFEPKDPNRVITDPPIGTIVRHYMNRMYIAQKNVLWYSEPGAYGAFDLVRGFFMYATDIRMVRPVDGGIYVSSSRNTYRLTGATPLEFQQAIVAPYPAIEGTDAVFHGSLEFGQQGPVLVEGTANSALWLSPYGVCFGGGLFFNVTMDTIADFPTGLIGSGLVHGGKYVGLIDP